MEAQRIASWPHTPTRPGTLVSLQGQDGLFMVRGSFIAYESGKKRHAYILTDEAGTLCLSLNGWHTPFSWLQERTAELKACARELDALKVALDFAVGEQ